MEKFERILQSIALHELEPQKTVIVSGPQGVGKTRFLQNIFNYYDGKCFLLNAADPDDRTFLFHGNEALYHQDLGNKALLLIDEAQHIPNIAEMIHFIKNMFPNLKIILTGTFNIDLGSLQEKPAEYILYPLTDKECQQLNSGIKRMQHLEQRLIYGNYPKILQLSTNEEKQAYLNELFNIYLTRDILSTGNKNKMTKVINLLGLIGYQIGHELFYRKIEKKLALTRHTAERYLQLCSRLSIIHQLKGYKKNQKKEVTNNSNWYFMDNGIRNAVIGNFSPLALRDDTEVLWKNYLIAERIKKQHYYMRRVKNYFWRTYDHQELDMVEVKGGRLYGYKFSWYEDYQKIPIAWRKSYPRARFRLITPENYQDWID